MTDFTTSNWREQMEAENKDLDDRDQAAKQAGLLLDRYLQEPMGDGYAIYRIVKVRARTVVVEHMDIGDAYRSPMIESMNCVIPVKYARENISFRDGISEIFSKR